MRATTRGRYSPVPVVLVDIEQPQAEPARAEGCEEVLFFFSFRGTIVGQAHLPVIDGRVPVSDLKDALLECGPAVHRQLLSPPLRQGPESALATVVVCTRDRPELLRQCLDSLTMLRHPPGEIIVVDSAPSNEAGYRVATGFPAVRYFRAETPGLNVARNLGIRHSRGEYVAFTDDDAQVHAGWLEGMLPEFAHPMTALVCGITLPARIDTKAQWLFEQHSTFGRGYSRREFSLENANLFGTGAFGAGVNMCIRKAVLDGTGLFDEVLDGGTPTESGGDQEFFYRVLARGHRIVYQPGALVWHRHRSTMEEATGVLRGYGTGVFAWWTKAVIVDREYSLLVKAPLWFARHHMVLLLKSLLRLPGAPPLAFAAAEVSGALRGPLAYGRSRWFHPAP